MDKLKENEALLISDYDYLLPEERIAKFPLTKRDSSRLLVYKGGEIKEDIFSGLSAYIPENSLLVYNNTRVIQARLIFRKSTGARIEVFCLEPYEPVEYALSLAATTQCVWKCMVGNLKKWKSEDLVKTIVSDNRSFELKARLLHSENNIHTVRFSWNNPAVHFAEILEKAGELPIPPYLNRNTEESDKTTYQTVYSRVKGSVAAPTAGLHFTDDTFRSLKEKNIETEELTLHVGAGTFQPVKTENVLDHHMHAEVIEVKKNTVQHLISKAGNIIAVGTTSVRTLESLYYIGLMISRNPEITDLHVSQWAPYESENNISVQESLKQILDYMDKRNLVSLHASTRIMIKPGYKFHVVNGIITNFHQPKSTLLLLVSAFVNGKWKSIYDYALSHDFRFLSYGDSSLLLQE